MKEKLRNLKSVTHTRVLGQVLKSKPNREVYSWVMYQTSNMDEDTTIKERVHVILSGEHPSCTNGKIRKFNTNTEKYMFCGTVDKCVCHNSHYIENRIPLSAETMQLILKKRKTTWIEKYGVDNPSKHSDVVKKRADTMKGEFYDNLYKQMQHNKQTAGYQAIVNRVSNVVSPRFSREEYVGCFRKNFYEWSCNACGGDVVDHVDYGRIPRCLTCFPNGKSKAEQDIRDYVASLGFEVLRNNRDVLLNQEYDIWIPSKRIAIEYNGVYWHSTEWKEPAYHVNKFIRSRENGVKLIQIFEDEWNNKPEIIKHRLQSILGCSPRLYARQCSVSEISSSEYVDFTTRHHLQGHAASSHKIGLYNHDKLVAVMGFSKSRYTKIGYELIRYCSTGTIVGGAGKLFSFFLKMYNPDRIISYANRCWSDGNLYKALGFTNTTVHDGNVGYWYVKNNVRHHRSTFTKSNLVKLGYDESMTESEIMKKAGYFKIYDCGNYRFEWPGQLLVDNQ